MFFSALVKLTTGIEKPPGNSIRRASKSERMFCSVAVVLQFQAECLHLELRCLRRRTRNMLHFVRRSLFVYSSQRQKVQIRRRL